MEFNTQEEQDLFDKLIELVKEEQTAYRVICVCRDMAEFENSTFEEAFKRMMGGWNIPL